MVKNTNRKSDSKNKKMSTKIKQKLETQMKKKPTKEI